MIFDFDFEISMEWRSLWFHVDPSHDTKDMYFREYLLELMYPFISEDDILYSPETSTPQNSSRDI